MKHAFVIAALAGLAGFAQGQVVINLGNLNVNSTTGLSIDLNGAAIPAGVYESATLTTNWVAGPGIPFSSEAIWALTDNQFIVGVSDPTLFTFFADPGPAPNSLASGAPVSLAWNADFDVNYTGGNSLWFTALQTFGGSSATWGNTVLTLFTNATPANFFTPSGPLSPAAPAAIDLGVLGSEGNYVIDTLASPDLDGDGNGDFDSELGLYSQTGEFIATNDDGIPGVFGPSLIDVAAETTFDGLGAGVYFIALSGFNSLFGPDFGATPDGALGSDGGQYVLSVNGTELFAGSHPEDSVTWFRFEVVPAPSTLALLGLGSLAAARRRR
jgi:hypothetical protein